MELSNPSTLALIIHRKGVSEPIGIDLTNSLALNQWYQLKIHVDRKNRLEVFLNGAAVKDTGAVDYKISDMAIGTGFSKMRNFDGELSNFTLGYKLFKKHYTIAAFFLIAKIICLASLAFIVGLYLTKLTLFSRKDYFSGIHNVKHRFFLKFLVVMLPVIIVIGYVEHGLSGMSTHYYKKRILLEKKLAEIEVLSVGSSNAYYGINPQFFSYSGFNLAFLAQTRVSPIEKPDSVTSRK